jgi:hypothetical protein
VKYFFLVFFAVGCASTMKNWRASLMGDSEVSSRSPASTQELSIENKSGTALDDETDALGPDLASHELVPGQSHYNEKSSLGFRRNANPWYGTQPDNEGSLWNSDSQDGFLFSKNLLHKIGDIIIVKIEPDISETLNEKIDSMLGRSSLNHVVADEAGNLAKDKIKGKVRKALGNDNVGEAVGEAAKERTVSSLETKRRR